MRHLALLLILSVWPALAHAHGSGLTIPTGWTVPTGLDLGLAFGGDDGVGFTLGGELSVVYLSDELWWAGLVTSARYDWAVDHALYAVGPEIGFAFVGVEALAEHRDGDWGARLRLVVPGPLLTGYVGLTTAGGARGEVGLLLKFPLGVQ